MLIQLKTALIYSQNLISVGKNKTKFHYQFIVN